MKILLYGIVASWVVCASLNALGQESAHPLQPLDRSSPRAALETFLKAGDDLGDFLVRDYVASPTRAEFNRAELLGGHLMQGLDLSRVPPSVRSKAGRAAAVALYETLSRIELPPISEIPDRDPYGRIPGTNSLCWTIPNTEISLVRGAAGAFLFSPETVAKADDYYARVRGRAYCRPVPLKHMLDMLVCGGGWMIPHVWIQAMPAWLRIPLFGQACWKLIAFALLLGMFVVFMVVAFRLSRRGSSSHPFRRALAQMVFPLYFLVAVPMVAYLACAQINLRDNFAGTIELVATLFVYLAGAWISWRMAPVVGEAILASPRIAPEGIDAHLIRICTRLLGIVGGAVLLAVGANQEGIPVYGIIAGLGVGGLAIALSAQPTIENLIGGLSLFADKPLVVGDHCRCGSDEGTIEAIGIRSTRIRGTDRSLTSIPNAELSKMAIVNFAQRDRMLIKTVLNIRYGTSPDQLRNLLGKIRELLGGDSRISPDKAHARFIGFGDSSLDVEVVAYVMTNDRAEFLGIQEDIWLRVMDIVEQSGTGFACPPQVQDLSRERGI